MTLGSQDATRNLIQYTHLEKLYGYLPGMQRTLPGIFDMSREEYEEVRGSFEAAARAAAGELLRDVRVAGLVDALPLRIVGQPRVPVLLRTTDSASSFDRRNGEWVTRGDRHRELLRAFSDAPGKSAFPFKTTTDVVDIRPELQLRFSPRRKETSDA